jgi:hypothetical protein
MSVYFLTFVFAAPGAPTDLHIESNFSATLDEGAFSVNWTSGAGDAAANYSIYMYADNVLYSVATNDSVTGYSFSNTTDALYTFIIEAVNATGSTANSSGNVSISVSISVDTTAPVFSLVSPANTTYTSTTVNLNVSGDGSENVWWYSLNGGSNTTFSPNTTISGIEGSNNITVWVNDTIGNVDSNAVSFTINTTAPTITINSPTSADKTSLLQLVNISSDGDATWYNHNGTNVSYTAVINVTFSEGSNTLYVYSNNSLGTEATASVTFTINTTTPTTPDSTPSSSSSGPVTYRPGVADMEDGYTRNVYKGWKIVMPILGEDHTLNVDSTSGDMITITVSSTPQTVEMTIGEEKIFDVNDDGVSDLQVTLNSKIGNLYSITIKSIEVGADDAVAGDVAADDGASLGESVSGENGVSADEEGSNGLIWIVVIIVIVLVVYLKRDFLGKFLKK